MLRGKPPNTPDFQVKGEIGLRKWPIRIEIYLNERQKEHLDKQVLISGLTMQAYIRTLIEEKELKPKPPEEYKALLRELSAIGNNINQIAKVANSKGFIAKTEIENLQKLQSAIWQKVKGL